MAESFNELLLTTLINSPHLSEEIERPLNRLFLENVGTFLTTKNRIERKETAVQAIKELWTIWERQDAFVPYLERLKTTEVAALIFDEDNRDHLVHSLYVYLLGHYLISVSGIIRENCWDDKEYFLFEWGMTASLHDIAYPLELHSKQIGSFLEKEFPDEKDKTVLGFRITDEVLVRLSEGDFDLWDYLRNYFITECGIEDFDIKKYFERECSNKGIINHGIFGGLFVLRKFLNMGEFDSSIMDIAGAITLHNLEKDIRLDLEDNPLAYLLVLADELQDWDRPSIDKDLIPPTGVNISASGEEGEEIICKTILPRHIIAEKEELLSRKLNDKHVFIEFRPVLPY
ncbi:MAG TPA: hypothetical protein VMX79_03075 [bacterium]|nr:hypothetical protein [bacterium]